MSVLSTEGGRLSLRLQQNEESVPANLGFVTGIFCGSTWKFGGIKLSGSSTWK